MRNSLNPGPSFQERANLYARERNISYRQACSELAKRRRRKRSRPIDPSEVFAREERMGRA